MIDYEGLQTHREQTKKDILELLKTEDRVACVRPTGYGKSHLIAKLCNELEGSKLVLEPGNAIIDYMEKFSIETYNTDYATYHSLLNPKIEQLIEKFKSYDYIFLDEMHRALAERWGKQLEAIFKELEKLPNSIKTIGFSATPIRSDNRNVIDEIFKGVQIEPYYLADAILDSFLPNINYHSSIYEITNKQKQTLIQKDTPLAKQILQYDIDEGVSKIFRENLDLDKEHKIICFVDKISNIPEAISNIKKWFKKDINIYKVHSKQSNTVNNKILKDFQNDSGLNIVFAVNILNEGVHIPGVDCVIFLRKTASTILYNQQLGRVVSDYNEEPIVFDLVNNIDNLNDGYSMIFNQRANSLGIKTEQLVTKTGEHLNIITHQVDLIHKLRNSIQRKVNEEEIQFIIDNYEVMSTEELAKYLKLSVHTIKNYKRKLGLTKKCQVLTDEEKQFILDNYKTMTVNKMRFKLNKSFDVVRKFCVDNNIWSTVIIPATEEEIQFILDNYKTMTLKEMSENLNRSCSFVNTIKRNHGLTNKINIMTDEDRQFVLDNYKTMTSSEIAAKLNRKRDSIYKFLKDRNLTPLKGAHSSMTDEEKQFILDNYKTMTSKEIAAKLNRKAPSVNNFLRKNHLTISGSPLTNEEKQFILDNHKTMTVKELSVNLNRSDSVVDAFCLNNNLEPRRMIGKMTPEDVKFIKDNSNRFTLKEMAYKLNLNVKNLRVYYYKYNLDYKKVNKHNINKGGDKNGSMGQSK